MDDTIATNIVMEPEPTEQDTAAPATPSDPMDDERFSQRDMDRVLAKQRREMESKSHRQPRQPPRSNGKTEQNEQIAAMSAQVEAMASQLAESQKREQFSEATGGLTLTKEQRAIMRTAFNSAAPEDGEAWARDFSKAFGLGSDDKGPEQSMPAAEPTPASPENAALLQRSASPQEAIDRGTLQPKDLTPQDCARMGPDELWKFVKGHYKAEPIS